MRTLTLSVVLLLMSSAATVAQAPTPAPATNAKIQPVASEDAPTPEQVTRMFELMRLRQQVEVVMEAAMQQSRKMVEDTVAGKMGQLPPEAAEDMENLLDEAFLETRRLVNLDEMLADMVPIYQKYLTKGDVEAISAFYMSPQGQRLLERGPVMATEAMQVTFERQRARLQEFNLWMEARVKQLIEKHMHVDDHGSTAPSREKSSVAPTARKSAPRKSTPAIAPRK